MQELVERYLEIFNQTDASARMAQLREMFTDDATYTDPQVQLRGPAAISEFVTETQRSFPGFLFKLRGGVDAHHDQARFQWQAGPAEQPDLFVGFDVVVTDGGRIRAVHGFMDAAPAV